MGNNDAEHAAPCEKGGPFFKPGQSTTNAWAESLIDLGIVNNDLGWKYSDEQAGTIDQIQFFRKTG